VDDLKQTGRTTRMIRKATTVGLDKAIRKYPKPVAVICATQQDIRRIAELIVDQLDPDWQVRYYRHLNKIYAVKMGRSAIYQLFTIRDRANATFQTYAAVYVDHYVYEYALWWKHLRV
jgi:hypothetical protein